MGSFPLTLSTGFESKLCCASQANLVQALPASSVFKYLQINPLFSSVHIIEEPDSPKSNLFYNSKSSSGFVIWCDWHISKLVIFCRPQHCFQCHLFMRDRGLRSPLQTTQIAQHTHPEVPAISKKWYPEMHTGIRSPPVCHKLLPFNYGAGCGLVLLNLFNTEVTICHRII